MEEKTLRYKKIMILAILLVSLLAVSAVSAADNVTDDIVSVDDTADEIVSGDVIGGESAIEDYDGKYTDSNAGTFTELANEIAKAKNVLNLNKNYRYSSSDSDYKEGIIIDKKIVINGNGHTIDGNEEARIFYVNASDVVLNNIIFENGFSYSSSYALSCGAAVCWIGDGGVLANCSFLNSYSYTYSSVHVYSNPSIYNEGGAVCWNGDYGVLDNCYFENSQTYCSSFFVGKYEYTYYPSYSSNYYPSYRYSYGGAVSWNGAEGVIQGCTFVNSSSYAAKPTYGGSSSYGGAVSWYGVDGILRDCAFVNSSATYGGAVYWHAVNGMIYDCAFGGCSANWGGSVYWYSDDGILGDSIFIGSAANNCGGAVFWCGADGYLVDSSFVNCYAADTGGAVRWNGDVGSVIRPIFRNCVANNNGSGIYFTGANCSLISSTFIGGSDYYSENPLYGIMEVSAAYENGELVVTLTNGVTGKAITSTTIQVEINGKTTTVKTNSKGQAKVSAPDLPSGTNTATVSYAGDSIYAPGSASITFTTKTDIIISAVYDEDANEIVATLKNGATGKAVSSATVQVNINGKKTTVKTDTKGKAKVSAAGLPLGTNKATISYAGNSKYNPASTSISFNVKTKVIVTDVYAYSDRIVAKLTNGATGKFIANANMIVEINGVKYNAKSDNKGQLIFDTTGLNLPSSFDLTISYRGNDRYTASSATVAVDLNKANMMITTNYHADKQKLVATLKNSKTGKIVSNANMIIELNGVKTTYKSNDQGKIILPTADFAPGTYVGTVTYPGNARYNSISAVFKIDI